MGIIGLGTDIVDVARLTRLIERGGPRFLERWFRASELEIRPGGSEALHVAALLATKEATVKALRVSANGPVPWRDIEVTLQPGLSLHGRLRALAAERGACAFRVSMAQTPDHAMATVVALSKADQARL
nr:holo-ACP synthase [Janibacter cremeus]